MKSKLGIAVAALVWALGLATGIQGLTVSAETSSYRPPVDAPAHDRYAATAYCVTASFPHGMPYTAVMRDDEDAIDAAIMRIWDSGVRCDAINVDVIYLP